MIPLSPIDYYFLRPNLYTIQFVFEYDRPLNAERIGLAFKELSQFNPIGRFHLVELSDHEVVLQDSRKDIPVAVAKVSEEPCVTTMDGLLTLIDPVINEFKSPLVKVLVTESPSKFYLGVSFSHILGDGFSFLMYMRSVARVFQGHPLDHSVDHDRSRLIPNSESRSQKSALQSLFADTGYDKIQSDAPREMIHEHFHFSSKELSELKQSVTLNTAEKISDNDVIMASLLLRYRDRVPLTRTGKLLVRCPVDYRRILPGFPTFYFGNAIKDAFAMFTPESEAEMSFANIVQSIRSAVKAVNPDSIQKGLRSLDNLRQEEGLKIFKDIGCPGLLVTNLSKLPFFEIDLGSGPPLRFFPATPCSQLGIILPAKDGVTVQVSI
jgi:hypothetical protein